MSKPNFSAQLPERTMSQIEALKPLYNGNKTQIVIDAINRLHQQEIDTMKTYYNVYALNDQGASLTVATQLKSISACEKAARAELGSGWTVRIDRIDVDGEGNGGHEEVKRFRIR